MLRPRAPLVLRVALAAGVTLAGCGVRTPPPIDVGALVRAKGATLARRSLEVRVVAAPRDVQARLALATLADEQQRPSQAIAQLEAVLALGGPIGTRWRDADRARLARLLAARGHVRLARGAPAAERDLVRARELGALVDDAAMRSAIRAGALVQLRHVDARERAAGARRLAATERGAAATATAAARGAFGMMLWQAGARRAAWDALAAWHAAATAPHDPRLLAAYLEARAWWTPVDGEPPPAALLAGAGRCRFAAARCVAVRGLDAAAVDALVAGASTPTTDPDEAAAWVGITLREALRGHGGWGALLAARVDVAAVDERRVPAVARAAFTQLKRTTRGEPNIPEPDALESLAPADRLVVAAARALRGGSLRDVAVALGSMPGAEAAALRAIVTPREPIVVPRPFEAAAAAYARGRLAGGSAATSVTPLATLEQIAIAYAREPGIAERLATDAIATSRDAALAHATLGALFDALGDPARARAYWQAAVDGSPEPGFLRGLASALARAGDPDATLVVATAAAAAWGDPAVVWLEVARSLQATGEHVHALEAARYAIDLAGPAVHAPALDVAIAANQSLGRPAQVAALARRRAAAFHPVGTAAAHDPTDPARALAALDATPDDPAALERVWVAARWNARDVATRAALVRALPADDARARIAIAELVALAAADDAERARQAVAAIPRR